MMLELRLEIHRLNIVTDWSHGGAVFAGTLTAQTQTKSYLIWRSSNATEGQVVQLQTSEETKSHQNLKFFYQFFQFSF